MGRQAAGESFMRAFIDFYGQEELDVLLHTPKEASNAKSFLKSNNGIDNVNVANLWQLKQFTNQTLYLPSPSIGEMAVHRAKFDERQFSLCGVTHTTATHRVMESIANLLTDPIRPWDALICTSSSVKQSVEVILQEKMEYFQWKLGATRFELPQLPVIPLGVHCKDYQNPILHARETYNIAANDIVVVYLGRLSFHAKAHPHPMLVALQNATKQIRDKTQKVHLLQCGWFANEHIEVAFEESQQFLAPNITHHYIDGRNKDAVKQVWAMADIFVSLSDNIQETFGLTPIEAMAAGIVCVVSDWNGYKDTIVHEQTGFRIKTTMPSANGVGEMLAQRYATNEDSYDMYCGHSCETISVDIPETTHYLTQLFNSKELRIRLGEAGRKRAASKYDWGVIMRQYNDLWEQLAEIRLSHKEKFGAMPHKVMAHHMDPYRLFAHYPTTQLNDNSQFVINHGLLEPDFSKIVALKGHTFAKNILPSFNEVSTILSLCQTEQKQSPPELKQLYVRSSLPAQRIEVTLSWLLKIGVLSFVNEA